MATCITPKPTISGEITHETQERETWFSDIPNNGGFAFTYKADSNQIAFLQMLSSKASQNVTYHCSNSVAHYHNRRQHHRKSIALQSWNDLEIRNRGKFRYNVIKDDCQVLKIEKKIRDFFRDFYNFFFLFSMNDLNGVPRYSVSKIPSLKGYQSWTLPCETLATPGKNSRLNWDPFAFIKAKTFPI